MSDGALRVVFVTSDVTYVRDNYHALIRRVCDRKLLPEGVEPVGLVLLTVSRAVLLKNILGLPLVGAPQFAFTLARNLMRAGMLDPRSAVAETAGMPILRCRSVNEPSAVEWLRERRADLIVNMRTRNIYKDIVLGLPKIGCINIHHGILPENRGTMCDLWAWAEGRPVGFTIHWMNAKIDDGDILVRREVDVRGLRCYLDIPQASSRIEAEALIDVLGKVRREGRWVGIPNRTETIDYRRNPTPSQIVELRRRGLRL
ncbi:MAG TPA: formyltransferase family protein [Candidatus Ozemobacteraceae bacterium]|nr:formyltransferase family protein [Candidatus Ozemobacteraceae bacterium]